MIPDNELISLDQMVWLINLKLDRVLERCDLHQKEIDEIKDALKPKNQELYPDHPRLCK